MALVFKVGEHADMLPVPPNFPQCGNWFGDGEENVIQNHAEVNKGVSVLSDNDDGAAVTSEAVKTELEKITTAPAILPEDKSDGDDAAEEGLEEIVATAAGPTDDSPDAASTVFQKSTDQTLAAEHTTTVLPKEKNPEETTTLSDKSLSNLKHLYFLYSVAGSKLKKDQLAHNEVSKELITITELRAREGMQKKEGVQSSVMRVPPKPRLPALATNHGGSVATEQKTKDASSLREPKHMLSEDAVQSKLYYKNNAVAISSSSVVALLISCLLLSCIL